VVKASGRFFEKKRRKKLLLTLDRAFEMACGYDS
jgi:hypothetical protein